MSFDSDYDNKKSSSNSIFLDNDDDKLNINLRNNQLIIISKIINFKYDKYFNYNDFTETINKNNEYAKIIKDWYKQNMKWIKQDPMKQLTGTFNPQKIEDLEEWYKIGGFYDFKITKEVSQLEITKEVSQLK